MSWIQGLAGKAEGLLNRMDQTAADTLYHSAEEAASVFSHRASDRDISRNAGRRIRRSGSNTSTVSDYISGFGIDGTVDKQDDLLYNEDSLSPRYVRRIASLRDIGGILEIDQKTTQKTVDIAKQRRTFGSQEQAEMPDLLTGNSTPLSSSTVSTSHGHSRTNSAGASFQSSVDQGESSSTEDSQRENVLLKNELQAQARDLTSALNRAKRAEQDVQKLINQLSTERQKFAAENDLREQDSLNASQTKDDQFNMLKDRVEMAERDTKLPGKLGKEEEPNKIMPNTSELSEKEGQLNEALQKLSDLEEAYEHERLRNTADRDRLGTTLRIVEDENREYLAAVASLKRSTAEERSILETLQNQLAQRTKDYDMSQQELLEYRRKANKILQVKDDIISSLKSGNGEISTENAVIEATEVENERSMLREEVQSLTERAESLVKQWREQQNVNEKSIFELRESLSSAQASLALESDRKKDLQVFIASYEDELRNTKTDFVKKEQILQQRIKDREEELHRVRAQMFNRTQPSDGEMETRMRVLTENLIQKQSVIDTLNSEKSSLFATVERLERRLQEYGTSRETQQVTIRMEEAFQNRNPRLLTEHEADTEVTRRLKRAYSAVDRFSFQLGSFLRRFPLARILVIGYMFLLHFWVLVVLLTYTPEVHNHEPKNG